ncbi:MAG: ribosome biogenesis GTPase YlqF [Eubacteriales bacterium]|nr:ribosome biogenesis GTPase YlqF [Eubacteriales bacterium]
MKIQWYPGHMTKAKRSMVSDVKLVDLVIELLDARAPRSTENPDIRKLTEGKKRLVLLNKSDLADDRATKLWIDKFRAEHCEVVALDSRRRDGIGLVKQAAARLSEEKWERDRRRGVLQKRAVRAMICGIPNVGKSTFINSLVGKASAKTGDKPGVTKGNQWLSVSSEFVLLDTPGVLWPKFDDETVGTHLAVIGAINDEIINREELAMCLISILLSDYPGLLAERYAITQDALSEKRSEAEESGVLGLNHEALAYLDLIAAKRGCLRRGGVPDYERAARLLIDDFRSGRLGKISLERPL